MLDLVELSYLSMEGSDITGELPVDVLITTFFRYCDYDQQNVLVKSRKRELVEKRQILCFYLKKNTRLSLADIGYKVRGYDHATVLHAIKTVKTLLDSKDKDFMYRNEKLLNLLK